MPTVTSGNFWLSATAGLAMVAAPPAAWADDPEAEDQIRVWGRSLELIGTAQSASEGVVGYDDFETRPISRIGELVEVVPGLVATQHSGTGKANQYFLRGFNLDHGTDFSAQIDGVPINLRTHGHGQGYLDLNFIIPEIVERVEFRKGPYFVDAGDFSAAGSAQFVTYDALPENFVEATGGENGFARLVAAGDVALGAGDLLLAGEYQVYDGPWVLDEDLEKLNLFAKYAGAWGEARYALTGSFYDSEWTSTDQVPLRAVQSGQIDRLGFIDPDLGGSTTRSALNASLTTPQFGGETDATAYVIAYDFNLFSNFTYFLDDPANGDEFEQRDRRWVYGGSAVYANHVHVGDLRPEYRVGVEARFDDIRDVGLFKTAGRERIETVRQDRVEQLSLSAFANTSMALTPALRANAGVRVDYYDAEVSAISLPANSGSADDTLVSPVAGLAWRTAEALEFYANYGRGFHSNDARGTTIRIDPASGEETAPVDFLVPAEGAELGARWQRGPLTATLSGFWLELDSELVFVGDAGATEVNGATRRLGVEGSAFWEASDWLVLDVSGGFTDAEFSDAPSGESEIPGAVKSVLAAGAVAVFDDFTGTLRLRHFGEAPLIEDGSVTSEPTTLVNLGASYDIGRVRLGLEVFNLFDAEDADITYFFESQLAGEANPVEDIHFHPVEPRQVRVSVGARF